MRTAFITQLIEEAKTNEKIFLLVGDLGYSVVEPFADLFPDRFLNVGIAEQNMTGLAAGLAKEGYNVFTYSIGNFPTLRCLEQIRYDICYHNLSVKIVSVGGGYAYGPLGASHHTTEDLAVMRVLPNMNVCAPADPIEAKEATSLFSKLLQPGYLRLGKAGENILHSHSTIKDITKVLEIRSGQNTAILSTGGILSEAKNFIALNKLNWGLFSIPFIKPIDKDGIEFICKKYNTIFTIEEHQLSAGFGSAILESVNDLINEKRLNTFPNIIRKGINDMFISYAGTQDFLREKAGLNFFTTHE
jgi:transketolase